MKKALIASLEVVLVIASFTCSVLIARLAYGRGTTSSTVIWSAPDLNINSISDSPKPITIASDKNGRIFGIFEIGGRYILRASNDLMNWTTVNENFLPDKYQLSIGRDLAVTNQGVILISATEMLEGKNITIFERSLDFGNTFDIVLNVSLAAEANDGPGDGFWHGLAETRNGTLFAGLYSPQGLVYRSVDSGATWTLVFNASSNGDWQREIHDVEVDPMNSFVYLVTDDESGQNNNATLWVSTDCGSSWKLIYAMTKGGAGLPLAVRPLAMGFVNDSTSNYMVLGIDKMKTRTLYLLIVEPSGELKEVYVFSANESLVDPFYTWWIQPLNHSHVFALSYDSGQISQLGAGLFVISSNRTLNTLMVMNCTIGTPKFLSMASLPSENRYAVLAASNHHIYLVVFTYPLTAVPEDMLTDLGFLALFGVGLTAAFVIVNRFFARADRSKYPTE